MFSSVDCIEDLLINIGCNLYIKFNLIMIFSFYGNNLIWRESYGTIYWVLSS